MAWPALLGDCVTETVFLNLPAPISVNDLWVPCIVKGKPSMRISSAYQKWKIAASYSINTQHAGRVAGPYALTLKVQDGLRLDLGNCEKAASDVLQSMSVIENDKLCREIHISWSPSIVGMTAQITATSGPRATAAKPVTQAWNAATDDARHALQALNVRTREVVAL